MDKNELERENLFFNEMREIFDFYDKNASFGERLEVEKRYQRHWWNFHHSGDGIYAMSAFNLCTQYGLPVPWWIKEWLQQGFDEYMRSQEDHETLSDLGVFLGVSTQRDNREKKHVRRGKNSVLAKTANSNRRFMINTLKDTYGFLIKEAVELVWTNEKVRGVTPMKPNTYTQLVKQYAEGNWSNDPDRTIHKDAKYHLRMLEIYKNHELSEKTAAALAAVIKSIKSGEFAN